MDAAHAQSPRRGLDYDDPIPDVTPLASPLTPETARQLAAQGISGLKLDKSIPADALILLADIPSLRRLDLSHRDDLNNRDLGFLAALPWLTALSLAGCRGIDDAALEPLRRHDRLDQINLQWTTTGDGAVDVLAGKPLLSRVVLGARLTDGGAARLRDFPALAHEGARDSFLSISSARTLTDDALAAIGRLQGVRALDVHMSAFGSPHYTARGAAHLRGMSSLEELNFCGHLAVDEVLRELAAIPRLRSLHSQDIASGDAGFLALSTCTTLERLGARFCRRITDRGFAAIATLPRLSSLGLGGLHLTAGVMASLTGAPSLIDLAPFLFEDAAFAFIRRIEPLERLTNMYNRATTDRATAHLAGHPRLAHYSAFGTQITDDSLRILARLPALENVELENCAGISDNGLADLVRSPTLRRLSVWSCLGVTGAWTSAAPAGVDVKSEAGPPGHAIGYRLETLIDYPDLPMFEDAQTPRAGQAAGLLSNTTFFGGHADVIDGGVRLSIDRDFDSRWAGLMTREPFAVPLRIDMVASPLTALRIIFGRHNNVLVFDEQGFPIDPAPWFTRLRAEVGRSYRNAAPIPPVSEWPRITLEIDERERRVFVDGVLRHDWQDDFSGMRSRLAIGTRGEPVTVRELRVEPLDSSG